MSVQSWQISEMSLAELLRAGKKVARENCDRELRIAILGDCATQHYCECLTAALRIRGFWPVVYEAEYDSIDLEISNPVSGLFKHRPDFVILFNCVQKLEEKFVAQDDENFGGGVVDALTSVWSKLKESGVGSVIQHNFCLPIFRAFGNFSVSTSRSLQTVVAQINAALVERAHDLGIRIIDTESQAAFFGKTNWLDERLWCDAKQALSPKFLPPMAKILTDVICERVGVSIKCVILDLDNTLWGGILGDAGFDGIEIGDVSSVGIAYQRFQRSLLGLKNRGVILAVSSKNDQQNVERVLSDHPDMILGARDFVIVRANYEDKVANIKAIQQTLNIAMSSIVFLDDSPFERDFVRSSIPELQVPDLPEDVAEFINKLALWNLFEVGSFSDEDRSRTEFYQTNVRRAEIQNQSSDLPAYLRALEMIADVRKFDSFTLPRAYQLFQRSNQFNLTTIRYTEDELAAISSATDRIGFTIRLRDRLGDNGIIATTVLTALGDTLKIDSWVMSCRVLGRRMEEFTLKTIVDFAREMDCTKVQGEYLPTSKNSMVADHYTRLGFSKILDGTDRQVFVLDLADYSDLDDLPIALASNELENA